MERKVTISPCNQFRFIPLDEVLPDKYNFRQFDKALFSEIQEYYMTKSEYAQKVQKSDPCRIQIKTTQNTFPVRLYVYKCGGELVSGPFNLTNFPLSPGLVEQGVERFIQRFENTTFFSTLDGVYYLVLECRFDEDGDTGLDYTDWFVSEPVSVKAKHPKTGLLEVSNSTNKDDVIFKQPRQKFSLRVESMLVPKESSRTAVVFNDQGQIPTLLSANTSRVCTLTFPKIPKWMVDKLEHYFDLDSIYYEGLGYTSIDASGFKYDVREISFGLYQISIDVTEKIGRGVYEYSKGGIQMFDQATTFPYVIFDTGIGNVGLSDYFYGTPVRIANQGQLDTWIAARNVELIAQGFTGEIAMSTTTVVYNRGAGENYNYAKSTVFYRRLGIKNVTTGVATVLLSLTMAGSGSSANFAVFNPVNALSGYGAAPPDIAASFLYSYGAAGAGTYTYELWHEGTITQLLIDGSLVSGLDKYGSSLALPPLSAFSIDNSQKLTAFSLFGDLTELRDTLISYRLKGNINLVDSGVYYPLNATSTKGWRKLSSIILQGNRLSTNMVNQWFNSMRSAMLAPEGPGFQFYVYDGKVWINDQVILATATSASAVARAALINTYGWDLLY